MYEKPMIFESNDMSEGVFMASGSQPSCYSVSAYIHQQIDLGGTVEYRIQVNAHHEADHGNDWQELTVSFNTPVVYKHCNGVLIDGNNTQTLRIQMYYHQNQTDNIGLGDLIVEAAPGLEITSISMSDAGHTW